VNSAQDSDFAPFGGNLSQSEQLSQNKSPLAKQKVWWSFQTRLFGMILGADE
jgi:hypothetical protein